MNKLTSPVANLRVERGTAIRADHFNSLADRVTGFGSDGIIGGRFSNQIRVPVRNIGEDAAEFGDVFAIKSHEGRDEASGELELASHAAFEIDRPTLPDDFAKLVLIDDEIAPEAVGEGILWGVGVAKFEQTQAQENPAVPHSYLAPKRDKAYRLVPNTSGVARLVHQGDHNFAVAFFGEGQPLYRYELTENWQDNGTNAVFSGIGIDTDDDPIEVCAGTLYDFNEIMSDQELGSQGICKLVGSAFIALQAPCEEE